MTYLAETAQRRNALCGLDLPLFAYMPANSVRANLTRGGALIHRRTSRPAETCNLIASLAGIGQETDHAR